MRWDLQTKKGGMIDSNRDRFKQLKWKSYLAWTVQPHSYVIMMQLFWL